MFFGCCCGSSGFYWLRKYTDTAQVNVIAETDVASFRTTGNPNKDYPIPRNVTIMGDKVEVVSNDNDTAPTTWMRHVYNTDLELLRTDQWSSQAYLHHTNGDCLALCTNSLVTVYDNAGAVKYTVSISPSDSVDRVCLDSSNNLYVSVYQFTGTGFQIWFIIKYNSSGIFQWRLARGSSGSVFDMEPASDDYIWVMRQGAIYSLIIDRVTPSGTYTSPSTGAFVGSRASILLADNTNGMWAVYRRDVYSSGVWADRYDSAGTRTNRFWTGMGSLRFALVNDTLALWGTAVFSSILSKQDGSGNTEYQWNSYGWTPGSKHWDGGSPACGAYSDSSIYLCGYRTQKE